MARIPHILALILGVAISSCAQHSADGSLAEGAERDVAATPAEQMNALTPVLSDAAELRCVATQEVRKGCACQRCTSKDVKSTRIALVGWISNERVQFAGEHQGVKYKVEVLDADTAKVRVSMTRTQTPAISIGKTSELSLTGERSLEIENVEYANAAEGEACEAILENGEQDGIEQHIKSIEAIPSGVIVQKLRCELLN